MTSPLELLELHGKILLIKGIFKIEKLQNIIQFGGDIEYWGM